MSPSSLVFVAIIGVWAAYLLPQWVRRRQHLAASRTLDRHSDRAQVLQPRRRPARTVSGPSSGRLHPQLATPAEKAETVVAQSLLPGTARLAARRRARVLLALVAVTLASWAAAVLGPLPNWTGLPGSALLILDVVALRAAARRRTLRATARRQVAPPEAAEPEITADEPVPERDPYDDAAVTESLWLAAKAREPGTWDPIPVPPPLYTLKPAHHPLPVEAPRPAAAVAEGEGEPAQLIDLDAALERRRAVNG